MYGRLPHSRERRNKTHDAHIRLLSPRSSAPKPLPDHGIQDMKVAAAVADEVTRCKELAAR